MIPQSWWSELPHGIWWLLLAPALALAWGLWERRRRRAARREGYRWALEHPLASMYQAILAAQARWPLRDTGQDPCLYDFMQGFHEARRRGATDTWSDTDLKVS